MPLFWCALVFLVGEWSVIHPLPGFATGIAVLFAICHWIGNQKGKLCLVISFVFILGWLRLSMEQNRITNIEHVLMSLNTKSLSLTGQLESTGKSRTGKYRYQLNSIRFDSLEVAVPTRCSFLFYSRDSIHCEPGDEIHLESVTFSLISSPRNPGEFDYHAYYTRHNVFGRLSTNDSTKIQVYPGDPNPILQGINGAKNWIKASIHRQLDPETSALITALILGDKQGLDPELIHQFQRVGVVHVLAVSGLHVGYILAILLLAVRTFRVPWGWDRLVVILGLAGYSALTGFRPSVIRAAGMGGLYIVAPLFNRRRNPYNIMGTVALLTLLIRPLSILETGFQLSYLAVLSIVVFLDQIEPQFPEAWRIQSMQRWWIKLIYSLGLISLAAQVGTLSVTASMFHTIPLIGILANCIIVPLIGILVSLGFILIFTSMIPGIGYAVAQSVWLIKAIITQAAAVLSQWKWASISIWGSSDSVVMLVYSGVLACLFLLNKRRFKQAIFGALALLSFVVWTWALKPLALELIFLDVGQGDAILLRLPDQRTMLVDGGPRTYWRDSGKEVILPTARWLGIHKFNWVVVTHPHSDHLGGLLSVLRTMQVDTLITASIQPHSNLESKLLSLMDSTGTILDTHRFGSYINGGRGSDIQFLWPPENGEQAGTINNQSIVLLVSEEATRVLLMGDLEREGEWALLRQWKLPKVKIIKIGHHGSITGTSEALLSVINPQLAVISVGARNKFGHPSEIVLERLKEHSIDVHRTDKLGALWVRMSKEKFEIVSWK